MISMVYLAVESAVVNTIDRTYTQRMTGRLSVILSHMQRPSCVQIGCIFFSMVEIGTYCIVLTYIVSNWFICFSSVKLINSRNALISCSACNSIGEIGRNGPLPLPAGVEKMDQGLDLFSVNSTKLS